MTDKLSREDVLKVAKDCGIAYYLTPSNTKEMHCTDSDLEHFAAAMYAAGAEGMRERAAKLCDEQANEPECPERADYCAEAIRALPVTQANPEVEKAERKDYCGSCGQWTGGPMVCCNEMGNKPDVTKTEAIAVRLAWKEKK